MKILVTESQKKALDELQWLETVNRHIIESRFPMTPKIYKLISGTRRVKVFHLSDIHEIDNLAKLRGTKKTISTFTYMNATTISDMKGIQTKGGVLYEIYGDLVIESPADIMSRPDENGIRWIDDYELLPRDGSSSPLRRIWNERISEFYIRNKVYVTYEALLSRGKTNLIKQYFLMAEKFVSEYVDEIKNNVSHKSKHYSSWNEILVNNIEIHDVYWTNIFMTNIYNNIESRNNYIKNPHIYIKRIRIKPLTPREERILNDYPGWVNKVQQKLESISTGTVYKSGSEPEINPLDFVRDRGGYVDFNQYDKTINR